MPGKHPSACLRMLRVSTKHPPINSLVVPSAIDDLCTKIALRQTLCTLTLSNWDALSPRMVANELRQCCVVVTTSIWGSKGFLVFCTVACSRLSYDLPMFCMFLVLLSISVPFHIALPSLGVFCLFLYIPMFSQRWQVFFRCAPVDVGHGVTSWS